MLFSTYDGYGPKPFQSNLKNVDQKVSPISLTLRIDCLIVLSRTVKIGEIVQLFITCMEKL